MKGEGGWGEGGVCCVDWLFWGVGKVGGMEVCGDLDCAEDARE